MALQFLFDENVNAKLSQALTRHNLRGEFPIDFVRVGEPADLPLSATDREILIWSEKEKRILLTNDKQTMPVHLADHLNSGGHSPGIFMIRRGGRVVTLCEYLIAAAYASEPNEWIDRITYIG